MQSKPLQSTCGGRPTEHSSVKGKSCHWNRGAKCSEAQFTQRKGHLAMCPCKGSHSQVRPSKSSPSSSESVLSAQYDGQQLGQHNVYSSVKVSFSILDEEQFLKIAFDKFRPPCPLEDETSYDVAESVKAAGEEEDLRPYFTVPTY